MPLHRTKPEHEVAYQDLCALMSRHADKLTPYELLAVAANMLGKLIALQDQRKVSPEMAMELVIKNIEHGNQDALKEIGQSKGRA